MKKLISFLSYHNAVPAALIVMVLGASGAFAASQGVLPLSPNASLPSIGVSPPESVDASALLDSDLDAFDFRPTVTGVVETDTLYTVSYSIETLAPEGSKWATLSKTGEFSVGKNALGDGGLNGYVVGKLRDIENGERLYLARAQTAEKALAEARQPRPASAFSALVGLALDQIVVPIVAKPAPEPQPQTPPLQPIPTPAETVATAPTPEPAATSTPTAASTPVIPEPAPVATTTPVATSTVSSDMATTDATSTTTPKTDITPTAIDLNSTTATSTADTASTTASSQ